MGKSKKKGEGVDWNGVVSQEGDDQREGEHSEDQDQKTEWPHHSWGQTINITSPHTIEKNQSILLSLFMSGKECVIIQFVFLDSQFAFTNFYLGKAPVR